MTEIRQLGQTAKQASYELAGASTQQKNAVLEQLCILLQQHESEILAANAKDIEQGRQNGLSEALLDRLLLTSQRLHAIAADISTVIGMPDPVGELLGGRQLQNGLNLSKKRVPLGVLGVIYEARPNVTIDVACLCLKTGNAVILRGGKETRHSNLILVELIQQALRSEDLPETAVQYVKDPDRARVTELLKLDDYVDMIIPRGGEGLHRLCREQATVPVITGGIGICHLFVDASANLPQAVKIVENAKVQRPSVCNALDTLLVHEDVAADFLPMLVKQLQQSDVQFKAEAQAMQIVADLDGVQAAGESDFDTEWLSLTLGLKVVDGLDSAITHIRQHSTQHSDGILTQSLSAAETFVQQVDSAAVYVNASTRFTDGSQFGLGAEVAVSTQKLHARGPMGLAELTTYKWIGIGQGLIRD